MASKQIDGKPKPPYYPDNLPPEAGQTGDSEHSTDSGMTSTEFDEPDLDYGQLPYGQPPHGQPPHGQPPHGQPPHGQPPHGQPLYGQPPHGQPPHGQPLHGQPPHGQPPHGQPPHGQPPHGQSLWDYAFPQLESQGGSDSNHELACCSDRIVLGNNTQLPTMAKLAPDTIPKDHQYWEDFVKQSGEDLNPGTTFKVSRNIYPGDTHEQKNPVELFVRKSFKGLFEAITTPTPSDHSDRTESVAQLNSAVQNKQAAPSSPQKYVVTGTQGVGTTAFGFYLLLRLVHMVSPGESILYQCTIQEVPKYVRIIRGNSPSSSSVEYSHSTTKSVTWFVCDLQSRQDIPQLVLTDRTIWIVIKPSPLDFRRSYPFTVLYMPLWEFEEIEQMLEKLHPSQYGILRHEKAAKKKHLDDSRRNHADALQVEINNAERNFLQIPPLSSTKLVLKIVQASDQFSSYLDQWDLKSKIQECKLQIDRRPEDKQMYKALNQFQVASSQAEKMYFTKLEELGAQFSEDISKLEETTFPQLSNAKWAFKVCGCLPSEYLHATKDQRPKVEEELKSEVRIRTCADMIRVINLMQTSDPLPKDVSQRLLHVSCDYDDNKKPLFNKPILLEPSPYVMSLLHEAEPEALSPQLLNFLERHYAPSEEHGTMFESAAHYAIKTGTTYHVHHLGTSEAPKEETTTLPISFKSRKKVKSDESRREITITSEDEDCYCQPEDNFPAIDALIPSQKYLFQMTIQREHPVNTKCLRDLLYNCLKWKDDLKKVKLIFIVLKRKHGKKNDVTFSAQQPDPKKEDKESNEMFAKIQQYRLVLPQGNPKY